MVTTRVLGIGILVAVLAPGCGGSPPSVASVPPAADDPAAPKPKGRRWGGWRYTGDREECFYVVGRRCFAERVAACDAASCGDKRCVDEGAGPATIRCE